MTRSGWPVTDRRIEMEKKAKRAEPSATDSGGIDHHVPVFSHCLTDSLDSRLKMLESIAASLLTKYLGDYVEGMQREPLVGALCTHNKPPTFPL